MNRALALELRRMVPDRTLRRSLSRVDCVHPLFNIAGNGCPHVSLVGFAARMAAVRGVKPLEKSMYRLLVAGTEYRRAESAEQLEALLDRLIRMGAIFQRFVPGLGWEEV
jgi:hypothetical protein